MTDSIIREEAQALAGNLASLWTGGRPVLTLIEKQVDGAVSPWDAVQRLGADGLEAAFSGPTRRDDLHHAFQALTRYLTAQTWYDRAATEDARLVELEQRPVAYFCMEYGLADWLQIYSGGLGVLAGDLLKEASDMGFPLVGVGLFYRHGFFHQTLSDQGWQGEEYPTLDPQTLPLELVVDGSGDILEVTVPVFDRIVAMRAWRLRIGRVSLILLDTDTPSNSDDDRRITANLYGGDQTTRVLQEIVLGVGGVRILRALGYDPSIYSMNEGHAAFLGLELLAESAARQGFAAAVEETRSRVVYTNHTVIPAGNDVFPRELVRGALMEYAAEQELDSDRLLELGADGSGGTFSMALLAFHLSGRANAVSRLHGEVIPREWPGFAVEVVTNGVHTPTWIGAEVRACLDDFASDWQSDAPVWEKIRDIPNDRLWAARKSQRQALVDWVNATQSEVQLRSDALTIVWARRFAEYKRAWLVASDMARLARILGDAARPVQLVIAGKAHPRDEGGKTVLQDLWRQIRSESGVSERVAFVVDYDVEAARLLVAGADLWLNTPRRPLEASGTSGMKSGSNGGLQLTVRDGWAAEVDWWDVGWGIEGGSDLEDAAQLYDYLENGVIPAFFERDADGLPAAWIERMKSTMIVTLSRYSARRMLRDYIHKLYLPLLEEQTNLRRVER